MAEKKLNSRYHKILKLFYDIQDDGIISQDDVFYSNKEIQILRKKEGFDYIIIHEAKKIFCGKVVE